MIYTQEALRTEPSMLSTETGLLHDGAGGSTRAGLLSVPGANGTYFGQVTLSVLPTFLPVI